jgi:hypothetical protein
VGVGVAGFEWVLDADVIRRLVPHLLRSHTTTPPPPVLVCRCRSHEVDLGW